MSTPPAIALDDENTWPSPLLSLLDEQIELLRAYEAEQRRIDRLCERDLDARCNPPPNPHKPKREVLLVDVNDLLGAATLVGYHCTRLVDEEANSIVSCGLTPLTPDLVIGRVRRREDAGDLSADAATRLLSNHLADQRGRTGMTWFIFTTASLRWEMGVWRLFTHWGGEALYVCYERDPEMGELLRSLGVPCIVEAAVPVADIETFCSVGERLVRCYLHHRRVSTDHSPNMEGFVREALPGFRIRRVIRFGDRDFRRLTRYPRWSRALR